MGLLIFISFYEFTKTWHFFCVILQFMQILVKNYSLFINYCLFIFILFFVTVLMQIFIPQLANYKLFLQIIIFLTIGLLIIFLLLFVILNAHGHQHNNDSQIKVMELDYLDHLMSHQPNIQIIFYFFIINF